MIEDEQEMMKYQNQEKPGDVHQFNELTKRMENQDERSKWIKEMSSELDTTVQNKKIGSVSPNSAEELTNFMRAQIDRKRQGIEDPDTDDENDPNLTQPQITAGDEDPNRTLPQITNEGGDPEGTQEQLMQADPEATDPQISMKRGRDPSDVGGREAMVGRGTADEDTEEEGDTEGEDFDRTEEDLGRGFDPEATVAQLGGGEPDPNATMIQGEGNESTFLIPPDQQDTMREDTFDRTEVYQPPQGQRDSSTQIIPRQRDGQGSTLPYQPPPGQGQSSTMIIPPDQRDTEMYTPTPDLGQSSTQIIPQPRLAPGGPPPSGPLTPGFQPQLPPQPGQDPPSGPPSGPPPPPPPGGDQGGSMNMGNDLYWRLMNEFQQLKETMFSTFQQVSDRLHEKELRENTKFQEIAQNIHDSYHLQTRLRQKLDTDDEKFDEMQGKLTDIENLMANTNELEKAKKDIMDLINSLPKYEGMDDFKASMTENLDQALRNAQESGQKTEAQLMAFQQNMHNQMGALMDMSARMKQDGDIRMAREFEGMAKQLEAQLNQMDNLSRGVADFMEKVELGKGAASAADPYPSPSPSAQQPVQNNIYTSGGAMGTITGGTGAGMPPPPQGAGEPPPPYPGGMGMGMGMPFPDVKDPQSQFGEDGVWVHYGEKVQELLNYGYQRLPPGIQPKPKQQVLGVLARPGEIHYFTLGSAASQKTMSDKKLKQLGFEQVPADFLGF